MTKRRKQYEEKRKVILKSKQDLDWLFKKRNELWEKVKNDIADHYNKNNK